MLIISKSIKELPATEIPPRVEYTLTDTGKELLPVIHKIITSSIHHTL